MEKSKLHGALLQHSDAGRPRHEGIKHDDQKHFSFLMKFSQAADSMTSSLNPLRGSLWYCSLSSTGVQRQTLMSNPNHINPSKGLIP